MLTYLDKIKQHISCLPLRDKKLAEQFIEKRDFDSLLEIVSSLVFMVSKNEHAIKKNPKLEGLVLDDLLNLQAEVVMYGQILLSRDVKEMQDNYEDEDVEYEF